jgi:hypothetical protein
MDKVLAPPREPPSRAGVAMSCQCSRHPGPTAPYIDREAIGTSRSKPITQRTPTQRDRETRWVCEWWPPD